MSDLRPLLRLARPRLRGVLLAEAAALLATVADVGLLALLARLSSPQASPIAAAGPLRDLAPALALIAIRGGLGWAQADLLARASAGLVKDVQDALFRRIQALPLRELREKGESDLVARLFHDSPLAASALLSTLPSALAVPIRALALLATIAALHQPIALGVLGLALPLLFGARWLGRRLASLHTLLRDALSGLYSAAESSLAAAEAVRAFSAEAAEARRFENLTASTAARHVRVGRDAASGEPLALAFTLAGLVLLASLGRADVLAGRAEAATVAAALAGALVFLATVRSLLGLSSSAQEGLVAASRVGELLHSVEPEPAPPAVAPELTPFRDVVRMENVHFAYPGREPLLRGIDLELRRGERLALVGETGGGKTTLLRLLLRLEEPTSGRITLDGQDLARLDLSSWRALLGYVPQDAQLLERSVAENARLGAPDAGPDEVREALAAAGLSSLLERLPEGLEASVGPRGTRLSGGERLELALARALLRRPEILLLDEVTGALDPASEARALDTLSRASTGRTLLIVTHRPSTARLADRLCVLQAGRIVQQGSWGELSRADGPFRAWLSKRG